MLRSLPLVLHILPVDIARGAQRYANELRNRLDGRGARHRILVLFRTNAGGVEPDLAIASTRKRRFGALDPEVALALRRMTNSLKPSVVVAHGSEPLKYAALALPWSVPVVYYRIGVATAAAKRGVRRAWHSLLLRRPAAVAGVSNECLEELREVYGLNRTRLQLIPNGRDPARFYPSPDGGSAALAFVGHLTRTKRPDLFLDVVKVLRDQGVTADAWMAGDGPMAQAISRRAEDCSVRLLGVRDDVPALLRQAGIFLFTSESEGEGMPGVLIEAGLSGLPVVTTDVPGASTVVQHGVTGFVSRLASKEELAEYARTLVLDSELRRRMGAAARERCVAEFTLERSVGLWPKLLAPYLSGVGPN